MRASKEAQELLPSQDFDDKVLDSVWREIADEERTANKARETRAEKVMDAAARRYERQTRAFLQRLGEMVDKRIRAEGRKEVGEKHNTPRSPHRAHDPRTRFRDLLSKPRSELSASEALEVAAHIDKVVEGFLHENRSTASKYGHGKEADYVAGRRKMHDDIVNAEMGNAAGVPRERLAIVMAGPMGSGKSYAIRHLGDALKRRGVDVDMNDFYEVDHDNMKEHMWKRGMAPKVRGLKQRETAGIIHAESSHIADRVTARLASQGTNMVIQGTMRNPRHARARTAALKRAGYRVLTINVDTDPDIAKRRAITRWQKNDAKDPVGGGRFVAPAAIDSLKMPRGSKHRSKPSQVFEDILKPNTDAWLHINNDDVPFIVDGGGAYP